MGDVTRELGHLEKLAKEDPEKRFNRLYRLVRQEQFLMLQSEFPCSRITRIDYGKRGGSKRDGGTWQAPEWNSRRNCCAVPAI